MTDLDHRYFAVPLFLIGVAAFAAGAIGLVVDAASTMQVNNPAGAMGFGLILIFASIAVTFVLNPGAAEASPPQRTIPIAAAAVILLLIAAVGGGAAIGSNVEAATPSGGLAGPGAAAATANGLLDTEEFSASLQGVRTLAPLGGLGGPGTPMQTHDLAIPAGATQVRFELMWEPASPGGASELELRFEAEDGSVIASATGGPGLVLDANDLAEGTRVVVSLPDGAASSAQEYTAYASYFDGAVPSEFTATE